MTKIEWTDETLNPIVGCTKVSPACANCYAERMARRLRATGLPQYQDVVDANGWTGKIGVNLAALDKLKTWWRKPRKIFMVSMGDLFHESVPFDVIKRVWWAMAASPWHTFQILTKRPHRMAEYLMYWNTVLDKPTSSHTDLKSVLHNVWLGVTVENQQYADERIPVLLNTPAAVRYLSVEPMLEEIDLNEREFLIDKRRFKHTVGRYIDFVICGGETGPGARPMNLDWARSLRDQCTEAGVPFFYKGAGTAQMKKTDPQYRLLDGELWEQFPEVNHEQW